MRQGTCPAAPASTTAAAVSSHDVSMPNTSIQFSGSWMRQRRLGVVRRLAEWRMEHTAVGDDGRDVPVRRHIERRVAYAGAFGRKSIGAHVRHLFRVPLLDR